MKTNLPHHKLTERDLVEWDRAARARGLRSFAFKIILIAMLALILSLLFANW